MENNKILNLQFSSNLNGKDFGNPLGLEGNPISGISISTKGSRPSVLDGPLKKGVEEAVLKAAPPSLQNLIDIRSTQFERDKKNLSIEDQLARQKEILSFQHQLAIVKAQLEEVPIDTLKAVVRDTTQQMKDFDKFSKNTIDFANFADLHDDNKDGFPDFDNDPTDGFSHLDPNNDGNIDDAFGNPDVDSEQNNSPDLTGKEGVPKGGFKDSPKDEPDNAGDANDAGEADASGEVDGSESDADSDPGPDRPIILDLDGTGIEITELSRSTMFMDSSGDGLLHRTAWAAAGNAVLFFDPDGRNEITEKRQYVFTEWDPTATSDLEAIASVFDSNGDGVLNATDADFAKFKLLVTNDDGSTSVKTLTELGITEINLTGDATQIELPDGSMITGQTTFTRSDGSTGTVANTALVSEIQGYNVVQTETTDGSGNRVVDTTAYGAGGEIAYAITSVTSPTGDSITNTYDDNGNGVVDRIQTIDTVTDGAGNKVETLINSAGAVTATAILINRTVTTTSADDKTVTIDRDTTGGGWFDQQEVRTTLPDDSRTTVINDLAEDGSIISSSNETISIDGLTRSTDVDEDGDGDTDVTEAHSITIHADDSRTEVVTLTNNDSTLRAAVTENVSADGQAKSIARDLDGDGDTDTLEELAITVNGDGSSASTLTVKNGDNSVRSSVTHAQSADALTKTIAADEDGDGDIDLNTVDTTVINVDGSRENTIVWTNNDGSGRGMKKVTLGADKVSSETWVDLNQNGVFEATDIVKSVTVDSVTQERTSEIWGRNPDGTIISKRTTVTSADGLNEVTTIDADGDGDTDTQITAVTVLNGAGVATKTTTTTNQDGSLRSKSVSTTSADGLTITTQTDVDGDGVYDNKVIDVRVLAGDGSITQTISEFAGDGSTLLNKSITDQSADRLTQTTQFDTDGDGNNDLIMSSVESADGSKIITETRYNADGSVVSKSVSSVSANGLVTTTSTDSNGDTFNETVVTGETVLNADGSRTRTVDVENADGSDRSLSVTTVSDDGLTTTVETDTNGDGIFERNTTGIAVLNANGSVTETVTERSADSSVLGIAQSTTSDDGLVVTNLSDSDGDGDFDLKNVTTTTLQDDGGTQLVSERLDASDVLFSKMTVTMSDDERSVIITDDVNGDGATDTIISDIVSDDGIRTLIQTEQNADGSLQSRNQTITSDDGLTVTASLDRDGDGIFENIMNDVTVLEADGSTTRTISEQAANGIVYSQSEIVTSDDGLVRTTSVDLNNDGANDLTTTDTLSRAANGIETRTILNKASDNVTAQVPQGIIFLPQESKCDSLRL